MWNDTVPNFGKNDDGQGNTNYTGYDRAKDLVNRMNYYFQNNIPMNLPILIPTGSSNNNTPVNDIKIQFVLAGVYFQKIRHEHISESENSWTINRDYGVNNFEEINIFMLNSPWRGADGVAACGGGWLCQNAGSLRFGKAVKIFSDYDVYLNGLDDPDYPGDDVDFISKLINHEVDHNLSLIHTWGYLNNSSDQCDFNSTLGYDETLNSNNCWKLGYVPSTSNGQPTVFTPCLGASCCDEESEVSNNLMDYNEVQRAVTPCQIDRMHAELTSQWGDTYRSDLNF